MGRGQNSFVSGRLVFTKRQDCNIVSCALSCCHVNAHDLAVVLPRHTLYKCTCVVQVYSH